MELLDMGVFHHLFNLFKEYTMYIRRNRARA